MVYSTGAPRKHSMDLRRIVSEVKERKRYEQALAGPPEDGPRPSNGGGAAGSLLVAVRERMLAENPEADVGQIDAALEPDSATPPEVAPEHATPPAGLTRTEGTATTGGDFIERYLEMSVEFEERFGISGWADFVAKKTEGNGRHRVRSGSRSGPKAKPKGKRKAKPSSRRKGKAAGAKRSTRRPRKGR